MSRLIEADALIKKFQSDKEYFDKVGDTTFVMAAIGVIHDIEDAPTIDAVEVVRCKECRHYKVYDFAINSAKYCSKHDMWSNDDDYCAWGERRYKETDHE